MYFLKSVVATVIAVGFALAAMADTPSYVGGPKGSPALSASRAAAPADRYAAMNDARVAPRKRSPWDGHPHP